MHLREGLAFLIRLGCVYFSYHLAQPDRAVLLTLLPLRIGTPRACDCRGQLDTTRTFVSERKSLYGHAPVLAYDEILTAIKALVRMGNLARVVFPYSGVTDRAMRVCGVFLDQVLSVEERITGHTHSDKWNIWAVFVFFAICRCHLIARSTKLFRLPDRLQ